ncbi:MAG: insulinase family protein [Chitinivibrionales bacterium]|nr:insulinase family protein [Chitinivibrionales bacterium]
MRGGRRQTVSFGSTGPPGPSRRRAIRNGGCMRRFTRSSDTHEGTHRGTCAARTGFGELPRQCYWGRIAAVLLALLALAATGLAEPTDDKHTPAIDFDLPVYYDSLENGLKVLIVPDTNVAVVSCRLYYFVGSMYEGPGTSGLSHMFEHMMFKGTKTLGTTNYRKEVPYMRQIDSLVAEAQEIEDRNTEAARKQLQDIRKRIGALLQQQREYIRKDELWNIYQSNGGTHLNAWTGDDMTAYIVTLPKNKLELFYWIESDRMANPVLREFYSERDVVTEERRMRYENRPVNRYWERLMGLFYIAHPYRIPTIGWMSDIRAYTREKLSSHVARYYTPDNALIVLAGNVDTTQAMKSIQRYFGHIPPASKPKQEVVTREPAPIGQTRFVVHDEAEPRIDIFFHTPGYPHDDLYRLDIAEGVLNGRSGRLYKRLVLDEQLCTDAGAGNSFRLHDGYFHVWATLNGDASPDTVERILFEELEKLAAAPPSEREMLRIKNTIKMSFVSGLTSLEGLSDRLAWFERLGGWRDLLDYPNRINAVEPSSVPDAAGQYFERRHATIGWLLPPSSETES